MLDAGLSQFPLGGAQRLVLRHRLDINQGWIILTAAVLAAALVRVLRFSVLLPIPLP